MKIILGNSISAYIIAACLMNKKEKFKLYIKENEFKPDILYLKCDSLDIAKYYLSIFNVQHNIYDYITTVRIGYYYDGKINNTITEVAKKNYLFKQNRQEFMCSMSDASNNFLAIDLIKIYEHLKKYIVASNLSLFYDYKNTQNTIYDTLNVLNVPIQAKNYGLEYIVPNDSLSTKNYSYIYDCSNSNIKRYTSKYIEYLVSKADSIKITNYYDEPKFYIKNNYIILGRNATKTQMKQKDIIDFILYDKGRVIDV